MENNVSNINSKYYQHLIKNNEDTTNEVPFRLILEIFNVYFILFQPVKCRV